MAALIVRNLPHIFANTRQRLPFRCNTNNTIININKNHARLTSASASASFSSKAGDASNSSSALSHPSSVDTQNPSRGRIICITSGKGGVGKTTSAASFAFGLAEKGYKTCVVDFDIGLRNLDIHLGMERRVIFDLVNVLLDECSLNQALIKDKRNGNLVMLAASQTRDKDCLTVDGVGKVLAGLANNFDYVVLDSPAGIESGARHAMYFADDAIIVTNPELSSCRDADKMVGFVSSRSRRAEIGEDVLPVSQTLLITRYDAERAEAEESLSIADMEELLGLPVVGVIPESKDVLTCTNLGVPIITMEKETSASGAYRDMVDRYLGEEKELRFVTPEPVSFFKRMFG
jgi:septum site-determining protein MinD